VFSRKCIRRAARDSEFLDMLYEIWPELEEWSL
jgi:hypothetical protein